MWRTVGIKEAFIQQGATIIGSLDCPMTCSVKHLNTARRPNEERNL